MNILATLLHAKEHLIDNRYWLQGDVNFQVQAAADDVQTQAKKQGLLVIAEESPA